MAGQPHEKQCKICNTLEAKDINALEMECLDRTESYTNIGAKYGIKYGIKITKQQVSNHMKWVKEKVIAPERDKMLEEQKKKVLDTMEEYNKLHEFMWSKIKELEDMKANASPTMIRNICNAQDRYVKSILKGLRLNAELTGDADRDIRKIDITVALKQLRGKVEEEE